MKVSERFRQLRPQGACTVKKSNQKMLSFQQRTYFLLLSFEVIQIRKLKNEFMTEEKVKLSIFGFPIFKSKQKTNHSYKAEVICLLRNTIGKFSVAKVSLKSLKFVKAQTIRTLIIMPFGKCFFHNFQVFLACWQKELQYGFEVILPQRKINVTQISFNNFHIWQFGVKFRIYNYHNVAYTN